MKIFDKAQPWTTKVNFVDEKNVILGFDTYDECCSFGGWFLLDDPEAWPKKDATGEYPKEPDQKTVDLPGWTFDTGYFKDRTLAEEYPETKAVQFRITDGNSSKYITLFNCHNGWYAKGFEFTVPDDPSKSRNGEV